LEFDFFLNNSKQVLMYIFSIIVKVWMHK
jgi:hypothetical protein